MSEQEQQCMRPLSQGAVESRKGPGSSTLDYVSQHYVRRRLCEVFGPMGFDTETRMSHVYGPTLVEETRKGRNGEYQYKKWTTVYEATVRITARTPDGKVTVKEGTAAGVGEDGQIGWSTHLAVTEAETDALKRAAMQLGDSFGLALYDKTQANVASQAFEDAMRLVESGAWDKESGSQIWPHLSQAEREQVKGAIAALKAKDVAEAAE